MIFKACNSSGDEPDRNGYIVSSRSSTQPISIIASIGKVMIKNMYLKDNQNHQNLTYRCEVFLVEGASTSKFINEA